MWSHSPMESPTQQQPPIGSKPSALPRLSRLPVPKSSLPNLRQQAASSAEKAATAPSFTKSRATSGVLPRNRAPLSATQTNSRAPLHARAASTASTASHDGVFKKPNARPLPRQQVSKTRKPSTSSGKSNTEDELGSLDSFRSASRSSSRQGIRDADLYNGISPPREAPNTPTLRKASRPSLSERTIESLARVPPSPAGRRRRSSFFAPDSPMAPLSRPTSSMGQDSRPTSRDGGFKSTQPSTPRTVPPKPINTKFANSAAATPSKRSTSSATSKFTRAHSPTKSSLLRSVDNQPGLSAPAKSTPRGPVRGSKTISGRMQRQRASVVDLFGGAPPQPPSQPPQSEAPAPKTPKTPKPKVQPLPKKLVLEESNTESKASPKLAAATKSSAALREQIRKAKAERRSMGKQNEGTAGDDFAVPGFDPKMHADPFNQGPKDGRSVLTRRVDAARTEGRLNIAAMGLKEIPEEVLKMYDFEFNKDSAIAWAETVDLTRFIAADNEIETIADEAFPDTDPDSLGQDDDNKGPQFGGLEVLDLHGNVLFDVPLGLRRLQNLTTLNLSRNRLMNDALETIAQITSLRELKIADNLLTGELTFIEQLYNLEVLEVQDNKLSALPDELRDLVKLRVLNVSNNNLMDLPMTELSQLPLVELLASKNKLAGALFTAAGTTMPRLQNLDVSINSLTTLYDGTAGPELPCLHTLNISFNSIAALPTLSTWEALGTIYAEDNKITALPAGFAESTSLRHVDFTGNDFSRLDERIALMDGLEVFKIAANPLRERKFLTMRTDDLKRDLRARIAPVGFAE